MAGAPDRIASLASRPAGWIRTQRRRVAAMAAVDRLRVRAAVAAATIREWRGRRPHPPLPPPRLRHRVHGAVDAASFVHVGRVCAADLRRQLALVGRDLASFGRILDFGCGCGRVAVHLFTPSDRARVDATDVDAAAIAWCRRRLAGIAAWHRNRSRPPTDYPAATFDLIYAVSVFTHLDGPAQRAWLEELKRIARPDALLLITLHGAAFEARASAATRARLLAEGVAWEPSRVPLQRGRPGGLNAFLTRAYVLREWSRLFTIVRYEERALNTTQDIVVLRNG